MDLRLIITDLDGTLLGRSSSLLKENTKALQAANRQGIHIAIASGRLALVCSQMALNMGLPDCHIIALNGTHVLNRPFGQPLFETQLPDQAVDQCLDIIENAGYTVSMYTSTGVYTNRKFKAESDLQRYKGNFPGGCHVVTGEDALNRGENDNPMKLFVRPGERPFSYTEAYEALSKVPGIYLTTSSKDAIEVMKEGVGKAQAAKQLAKDLSITSDQIAVFGDYDNDAPLLQWAKYSFAMENASPAAIQAAKYRTCSNLEAGVAKGIERLLRGME